MNKEQARDLVRQTLTQSFEKAQFRSFVLELLNDFDESKAFASNKTYIKDAFKPHVDCFERLGTYTSPDNEKLDVLIVHLTKESKLERARTAIRNFVADHLKQRDGKDAALVAFVSPTEKQWRFSYVKMEYATVKKDPNRVGVETKLTPARRFSYIVGEGESCHTAQTRFLDLLQDTDHNPTLPQLEEAFSVEAVTKEFFKKYAELFEEIKAALDKIAKKDARIGTEFSRKQVRTADFAKKLMGQIVFLYFIQKKGWLGVEKAKDWGTGPHDFLRRLAKGEYEEYENFFNDILEPLFYDTLATDRGHEAWCKRFNCRIPFLNGGLFEPLADYDWRKTDIVLPNRLFTNNEQFDDFSIGTGLLDMFDRYNFTVNEAEPLEKEVAIDPEMLGKVFENLIEENLRKGLGSYYTPREIVHYMCQESLINYLDTALNSVTETIGREKRKQAEFGDEKAEQALLTAPTRRDIVPREEIETFVHLGDQYLPYELAKQGGTIGRDYPRPPKSIEKHARLIDGKLADITVCDPAVGSGAFPVGMMTEIVRARSALTPYFNDLHERSPYFFKRHAIQSCLYGVDIDPGAVEIAKLRLWLSLVVDEEDLKQIKPLPNLFYKIVTGNSLLGVEKNLFNQQLFRRLEELKPRYFDEPDKEKKDRYKQQIEDTIHELTNGKEAFDFEIYFSEVFQRKGGFDVLIANPPYVRQEKIKELKPALKAFGYESFNGTADLYVFFFERGVKLLRRSGALAYISSNSFLNSAFGENLRRFLSTNTRIRQLIDFAETRVFEAITEPCVICLTRESAMHNEARFLKWDQSTLPERVRDIFEARSQAIHQRELKAESWQLESPVVLRLLEKLRRAGKPLGEYVRDKIFFGIKTGLNEAFVVDRATRERLIREHKSSAEIIKPLLRGRDVKRWETKFAEQYLITIESSENKDHPWSGKSAREAEKVFAATYPAIHSRFEGFRPALKKRKDQGKYFWELRSCVYWKEFRKPKIIYQDIARYFGMAWDDSGSLLLNSCYFLPATEKWMLAILLSSAMQFYVQKVIGSDEGGFIRLFTIHVEKFPIPVASPENQKAVERLVDRILVAKQRDAEADVSALEREIDLFVYTLYGLTPDEIKIVEGSSSPRKKRSAA
jgi:type I restriction-modification system DNA methylase subunit